MASYRVCLFILSQDNNEDGTPCADDEGTGIRTVSSEQNLEELPIDEPMPEVPKTAFEVGHRARSLRRLPTLPFCGQNN